MQNDVTTRLKSWRFRGDSECQMFFLKRRVDVGDGPARHGMWGGNVTPTTTEMASGNDAELEAQCGSIWHKPKIKTFIYIF